MNTVTACGELLTTTEAAERLKITRRYLYTLIHEGHIRTVRIPSRAGNAGEHRIEPAELVRFAEANRQR